MSLRKKQKNTEHISFSHPVISIEFFTKKYYKIHLKQPDPYWEEILNDTLDKIEPEKTEHIDKNIKFYYLKRNEYDDFVNLVENVENRKKRNSKQAEDENNKNEESYSESESSSESSSTDDEAIQKTLTRRLTSQSKGHEIDESHISDSELEDVISVCRRFRAVYKLITNMAKRIEKLENTVFQHK